MALRQRDRRAGARADTEHRYGKTARADRAASMPSLPAASAMRRIRRQRAGLFDPGAAPARCAHCGIAGHRRDAGIEGIDEIAHRLHVVGQRRGDEGIARIADQRGLQVAARIEVPDCGARAAARLDVGGQHGGASSDQHAPHRCNSGSFSRSRRTGQRNAGGSRTGREPRRGGSPAQRICLEQYGSSCASTTRCHAPPAAGAAPASVRAAATAREQLQRAQETEPASALIGPSPATGAGRASRAARRRKGQRNASASGQAYSSTRTQGLGLVGSRLEAIDVAVDAGQFGGVACAVEASAGALGHLRHHRHVSSADGCSDACRTASRRHQSAPMPTV